LVREDDRDRALWELAVLQDLCSALEIILGVDADGVVGSFSHIDCDSVLEEA
jgi:hypothetical protein